MPAAACCGDATGRARVGSTMVVLDEQSEDFYFGIGGGYDFNQQFSVGVAFDRYQFGENNANLEYDLLSVNTEVRF